MVGSGTKQKEVRIDDAFFYRCMHAHDKSYCLNVRSRCQNSGHSGTPLNASSILSSDQPKVCQLLVLGVESCMHGSNFVLRIIC